MFTDTHAHMFFDNFQDDLDDVLTRARTTGVDYIIIPGTDIKTSIEAIKLADKYDFIFAAAGVHPHDTKDWDSSWIDKIKELAAHDKVVAIGEIGLDYYYDFSPKDVQIKAFREQLDLAVELGLPVIIHNRDSNEDMMEIIRSYRDKDLRAQFHCFAGSLEDAKELITYNHMISFPGNITFKSREELREILRHIDVEDLLLETDSPFMTPVPHRGKRNEPAYVKLVAEKIAEVQNLTVEDVARTTSYNVFKLFGIGNKPEISYTYRIGESLYINTTNRCNAHCVFCDKDGDAVIKGYNLKMKKSEEPTVEQYISEIGDPTKYKEIVFCGYGEPTIRWDVIREVASYVKQNGGTTRINTNGHGNVINHRDITPEFEGIIDSISVSLNSVDPQQYASLMRVTPEMHAEMLDFVKKAKNYTRVVMTIVGMSDVDTEEAKKFVTKELGLEFRERVYF
ncbi:MAG: radical SAM protein [Melioribacteraceae bacterium]|nr:MAG: radical SAM protein [Melioribacteraceae bacterium]